LCEKINSVSGPPTQGVPMPWNNIGTMVNPAMAMATSLERSQNELEGAQRVHISAK